MPVPVDPCRLGYFVKPDRVPANDCFFIFVRQIVSLQKLIEFMPAVVGAEDLVGKITGEQEWLFPGRLEANPRPLSSQSKPTKIRPSVTWRLKYSLAFSFVRGPMRRSPF